MSRQNSEVIRRRTDEIAELIRIEPEAPILCTRFIEIYILFRLQNRSPVLYRFDP